jgi:hypothetical protein
MSKDYIVFTGQTRSYESGFGAESLNDAGDSMLIVFPPDSIGFDDDVIAELSKLPDGKKVTLIVRIDA